MHRYAAFHAVGMRRNVFALCAGAGIQFCAAYVRRSIRGTVGLSTGITPDLGVASKLVLIFTMFAGRVGAFTLLTLWIDRPLPNIRYTEESITIG